ncbi:hypothetical protein E4U31_003387 [Claviceps sp. LM219 group G6]|nr:hypothetical protein E4U31_003387 [Claviceps sp. LM219 group G6]
MADQKFSSRRRQQPGSFSSALDTDPPKLYQARDDSLYHFLRPSQSFLRGGTNAVDRNHMLEVHGSPAGA